MTSFITYYLSLDFYQSAIDFCRSISFKYRASFYLQYLYPVWEYWFPPCMTIYLIAYFPSARWPLGNCPPSYYTNAVAALILKTSHGCSALNRYSTLNISWASSWSGWFLHRSSWVYHCKWHSSVQEASYTIFQHATVDSLCFCSTSTIRLSASIF